MAVDEFVIKLKEIHRCPPYKCFWLNYQFLFLFVGEIKPREICFN